MKTVNLTKLTMLMILLLSSIMAISSTNILMIWLSLELNMFSFIPLLLNEMNTNEAEASMNYFLTQALGSTMFIMMSNSLLSMPWLSKMTTMFMMSAILLKMGAVPCHYWYPTTMEMISWSNCFILSTWQKIAPLFIMMYIISPMMKSPMMSIISSLNAITGGMMGMSQMSMKKIISYSSITHTGWMLSSSISNTPCLSLAYLSMYSLVTLPTFFIFNKMGTNKVYDLWLKHKPQSSLMILIPMLMLSMGGLPPLTGFIPKLLIMSMLMNHSIMTMIMLIMGSLMNLFFYLNISLNMLTGNQQMQHSNQKKFSMNMIHTTMALNFLGLFILMM